MPVHYGLDQPEDYRNGFLSIGNYDGVHAGHRAILTRLVERARTTGTDSCVLTFEPHPIQLLRPEVLPPRLSTLADKCQQILAAGVDHVVVYPTDESLLTLTAEEFFQRIVVAHFQARGLIEGPNFFFGKGRSGNIETLQNLCQTSGMSLDILSPALLTTTMMISSSSIRKSIEMGDVQAAAAQLGRRYSVSGLVTVGEQRGRTLGFPTANLSEVETMLPEDGVYAAFADLPVGQYVAAVNIGPNPTFGTATRKVEVHLLDFFGDLYGQKLRIEFVEQIRKIRTFGSVAELQSQIEQDVDQVREIASLTVDRG